MKRFYTHLFPLSIALLTLTLFTSCMDSDDNIGYDLQGHWFGDLDMWYDGIPARGSDIIFYPEGWGYSSGTGTQTDYYGRYGNTTVSHRFSYRITNGVIRLSFYGEPGLDCEISNYNLSHTHFWGRINGRHSSTNFDLRNYDREWNTYGYSSYDYDYDRRWYGSYYAKEQGATDASWEAESTLGAPTADSLRHETRSGVQPKAMRGVNLPK